MRMFNLRSAEDRDRAAVEALLTRETLPLEGVAENFAGFIVAEAQGRVVGAIGLERYGNRGLLRSAVVDPHWRGKGIGHALTETVLDVAREGGQVAVYLLTTTAADYFLRFGFRRIARGEVDPQVLQSAEFQGACPDTAVVMEARLQ